MQHLTNAGSLQSSRRLLSLVVGVVVLTAGGCVKQVEKDGALHFSMELWAVGLMAGVGIVLLVTGWAAAKNENWKGYLALIAGAFVLLGATPGMLMDYATLDATHLESRHGMWFAPKKYDIQFAQVQSMRVVETKSYSRRGSKYNYTLQLSYRDGRQESLSLGDLLKEAIPEVTDFAAAAGVQILPMQTAP